MSDGHSWTSGHQFWVGHSTRSSTSISYPFSLHEARLESSSSPRPEPGVSPGVSTRARPLLITTERRGREPCSYQLVSLPYRSQNRWPHSICLFSHSSVAQESSPKRGSLMRLKSRCRRGCPFWRLQDNICVLASSASRSRLHSSAPGPSPHLELPLSTLCLHPIFSLAPALRPPS